MASSTYHHFGVPTSVKSPNETYLEGGKLFLTDPEKDPYRIEYLRFEADSPMPKELQTMPHLAMLVPDVEAAIKGEKVIMAPFDATEELRCAFIMRGDALIELVQKRK